MTLRGYGRVTPSQMEMLCLAGGVVQGRDITTNATDDDRVQSMRDARSSLCRLTGMDFGYDLQQWHINLQKCGKDDPFGYRHPYAWRGVKQAIERFIDDGDRKRLVALIQERFPPADGDEWEKPLVLLPPMSPMEARALKLKVLGPPSHEAFTKVDAPPCPHCGQPLRTRSAKQCFRCGADWH
jgi:hypothetical protein